MTRAEFDKLYMKVESKPAFSWFGSKWKKEQALWAEVVDRYNNMKATKGDFFEKSVQRIEEAELDTIRKRKRKALLRIYIVVIVFFSAIGFFIWLEPADKRLQDPMEFFEFMFVAILAGGFWYFTNKNFNNVLAYREKRVIKGVLTNKIAAVERRDNDGGAAFFEISMQELVQVSSSQYHKHTLGDCLQIEILSDDMMLKRKIIKMGSLLS
jgi:hypothetical protein